jgi:hypothetical protein
VTSPLRACGLTPALPTDRAGRAAPVVAEMVFQAMKTKGHPAGFRTFCKGETMDSFLHACINYFKAFFEARAIREAEEREAEKRRDALAEGSRPAEAGGAAAAAVAAPPSKQLRAKEAEQQARMRDIALVYAAILLKHSNYANTQQEREFFECLYDFSKRVLFTINNRKHWHAIENELDRVFRSGYFNLSQRKNDSQAQGAAAQVSFKELYERAQGQDGRFPGSERSVNRSSNIHKALLMRSPIISEIFPTAKERAERAMQRAAEAAEEHSSPGNGRRAAGRGEQRDAPSRRDDSRQPMDSEAAMEALVQETNRSFAEMVG